MRPAPLIAAALLSIMTLAGCLDAGDSPDPFDADAAGASFQFPQDEYFAVAGTSDLYIQGALLFDTSLPENVTLHADPPSGWNVTLDLHEAPQNQTEDNQTGQDGKQIAFGLEVQVPGDIEEDETNLLQLRALSPDGNTLAQHFLPVTIAEAMVLPVTRTWDQTHLDILLVPPAHGPLASTEEGVLPYGPEGALPTGAYLDATLHVMKDWRHAIERTAANDTRLAWLTELTWEIHVIAEDDVTPQDIENADILKVYTETTGAVMGAAAGNPAGAGPRCIAYSSLLTFYGSLTYEDMYKLAGHELGHCLGNSHTENDPDDLDIMSQGGYPHHALRCPSNLNVRSLGASYAAAFDADWPASGATAQVPIPAYERHCDEENDPR